MFFGFENRKKVFRNASFSSFIIVWHAISRIEKRERDSWNESLVFFSANSQHKEGTLNFYGTSKGHIRDQFVSIFQDPHFDCKKVAFRPRKIEKNVVTVPILMTTSSPQTTIIRGSFSSTLWFKNRHIFLLMIYYLIVAKNSISTKNTYFINSLRKCGFVAFSSLNYDLYQYKVQFFWGKKKKCIQ